MSSQNLLYHFINIQKLPLKESSIFGKLILFTKKNIQKNAVTTKVAKNNYFKYTL
jgi:hypothetical protein